MPARYPHFMDVLGQLRSVRLFEERSARRDLRSAAAALQALAHRRAPPAAALSAHDLQPQEARRLDTASASYADETARRSAREFAKRKAAVDAAEAAARDALLRLRIVDTLIARRERAARMVAERHEAAEIDEANCRRPAGAPGVQERIGTAP